RNKTPPQTPKEHRMQQFPGSFLMSSGKELHHTVNSGMHIADLQTAKTMKNLIQEGRHLQDFPVENKAISDEINKIKDLLMQVADDELRTLTQPLSLQITNNNVSLNTSQEMSEKQWLEQHDKPGNYLVLNGNNDETYVSFIAQRVKNSAHLKIITSGFGGHGTTDRHTISTNQTEADRFKDILMSNGVAEEKILVDPWSTNSGQNAINVAGILNDQIQAEDKVTIIIAGTPAAVFRQTYTYAKQLDIAADSYQIESFPFSEKGAYITIPDKLAILREFSTTLHYLMNTDYLPADAQLYPDSFFDSAVDTIQTMAKGLKKKDTEVVEKYKSVIDAMESISAEMISRLKNNNHTTEDKNNIRIVDQFFRGLFNPLEMTFTRGSV
ncbi:YdcF family protein, partial [Pantoea sp.]|uniref:YdcF family protein n=1 Tax=Pantoea sp. TaxID=69393 RepID=UPI0028ABFAB8